MSKKKLVPPRCFTSKIFPDKGTYTILILHKAPNINQMPQDTTMLTGFLSQKRQGKFALILLPQHTMLQGTEVPASLIMASQVYFIEGLSLHSHVHSTVLLSHPGTLDQHSLSEQWPTRSSHHFL